MLSGADRPDHGALVTDLKLLREKGLVRLEQLRLPTLVAAGRIITADEAAADHVVIEAAVRRAVERFGGGPYGESAALLFGLDHGTRAHNSRARRELAAARLERSADTFRKRYESTMLAETAKQLLTLCTEQHAHEARDQREPREPAESAMAVEWLRRFESYYRLWSPIYGLANDLTASRLTLLEEPRPYDRRYGTSGPDDEGYSQEEQAEGYARHALCHYAHFEWELRRFVTRYGGLWMLSDAQVEQHVSDAVHRISWHVNPFNERDQSFLRTVLDETPNQELHGFLIRLAATEVGQATHREWQEWVATCSCTWEIGSGDDADYFPTHRSHRGISEECQVHQVIDASALYCKLIDEDWLKIADWYRLSDKIRRGISDERRYTEWRQTPQGVGYRAPE